MKGRLTNENVLRLHQAGRRIVKKKNDLDNRMSNIVLNNEKESKDKSSI